MNATKITSDLKVDDALVQDANYRFNSDDRQYIDNQILGIEQHLVAALIRGRHATYMRVNGSSPSLAVGDVVCLDSLDVGESQVIKASSGALGTAFAAYGIVLLPAPPGSWVLIAIGGALPRSVTGLDAAAAGFVRVNTTTGRCERVTSLSSGDFGIGTVDGGGNMSVVPGLLPGGSGGGSGVTVTGTGFVHATLGTIDTPTKKVDLSASADVMNVLPPDNGGTGHPVSDLAGQAGKAMVVNSTENGYSFTTFPTSTGGGSTAPDAILNFPSVGNLGDVDLTNSGTELANVVVVGNGTSTPGTLLGFKAPAPGKSGKVTLIVNTGGSIFQIYHDAGVASANGLSLPFTDHTGYTTLGAGCVVDFAYDDTINRWVPVSWNAAASAPMGGVQAPTGTGVPLVTAGRFNTSALVAGTAGNVLTDNGTAWVSAPPATGSSGEANTMANQGTGTGQVYLSKVGVVLNLRTLDVSAPLSIAQDPSGHASQIIFSLPGLTGWGTDGQSIRKVVGSDTWEWYTPASGGTGGGATSAGAAGSVQLSDGAGAFSADSSRTVANLRPTSTLNLGINGTNYMVLASGAIAISNPFVYAGTNPAASGWHRYPRNPGVVIAQRDNNNDEDMPALSITGNTDISSALSDLTIGSSGTNGYCNVSLDAFNGSFGHGRTSLKVNGVVAAGAVSDAIGQYWECNYPRIGSSTNNSPFASDGEIFFEDGIPAGTRSRAVSNGELRFKSWIFPTGSTSHYTFVLSLNAPTNAMFGYEKNVRVPSGCTVTFTSTNGEVIGPINGPAAFTLVHGTTHLWTIGV